MRISDSDAPKSHVQHMSQDREDPTRTTARSLNAADVKRFAEQIAQAERAVSAERSKEQGNHDRQGSSGRRGLSPIRKRTPIPAQSIKKLTSCSMATIALGAVLVSLSGFATASARPLDKAGNTIVMGQSPSPLAASALMPYEGHSNFSSWSDSYDNGQEMLGALGKSIKDRTLSGEKYLSQDVLEQVSGIDDEIDGNEIIGDIQEDLTSLNALSRLVDEEIGNGIAEEQAAAERDRRRSLVVDSLDPDGWSDEKLEFVVSWGERIDSYLSGRTLHGYGQNFAAAAYDYDVDPRVGAAISVIESGGGDVCFRSCNAWGWGSSSWDSWPEAIDGWTAAFHRGYGYDMDYADCRAYCPPNAGYYDKLRGQMESI